MKGPNFRNSDEIFVSSETIEGIISHVNQLLKQQLEIISTAAASRSTVDDNDWRDGYHTTYLDIATTKNFLAQHSIEDLQALAQRGLEGVNVTVDTYTAPEIIDQVMHEQHADFMKHIWPYISNVRDSL